MAFERLDHVGHDLGSQKACRSILSFSFFLIATPGCWILFLFLLVIHEFPFHKEHIIIPYSELVRDYLIHVPLPLVCSCSPFDNIKQFMLEKDCMNSINMAKPLNITVILDYMKFILEKSPINVKSVAKPLGVTTHTGENPYECKQSGKAFGKSLPFSYLKKFILEKSFMNVSLVKPSHSILYFYYIK